MRTCVRKQRRARGTLPTVHFKGGEYVAWRDLELALSPKQYKALLRWTKGKILPMDGFGALGVYVQQLKQWKEEQA